MAAKVAAFVQFVPSFDVWMKALSVPLAAVTWSVTATVLGAAIRALFPFGSTRVSRGDDLARDLEDPAARAREVDERDRGVRVGLLELQRRARGPGERRAVALRELPLRRRRRGRPAGTG